MIKARDEATPRHLQKELGPSEVGHPCMRKLALGMMDEPRCNPQYDPLPSIVGTATHKWLESAASYANVALGRQRWLVETRVNVAPGLAGSCDLYDKDTATVIDWKVPGANRFKMYVKEMSPVYRGQAHMYGRGYENAGLPVKQVAIALLPRGGTLSGMHLWREDYNPQLVDQILRRREAVMVMLNDFRVEIDPGRYEWFPKVRLTTACFVRGSNPTRDPPSNATERSTRESRTARRNRRARVRRTDRMRSARNGRRSHGHRATSDLQTSIPRRRCRHRGDASMTNVDNPLGRIRRHDPRSRRYAVSAAPAPGKSVRHSMNAPNVDQFYLGACSLLRDESEGLLRIIAIGHSHLRATAEHPILTSHGYVPAQDLVRGDEIAFPRYRSEMVTAAIDTSRYINKPSHRLPSNRRWTGPVWAKAPSKRGSSNVSIPEKIELDHKFIGLFLAEGHCGEYTATFTFADHELHTLAAEVVDTASELGVSAHVRVNTARHTTIVTIHSVGWSRLLSTLCGNGSGMKEPHRDLAAGSDEFLSGMLEGWLDGDGHHRKDGARQGVTVSRKLAMSMYDIGQVLERHPVIAYSRPTNNRDKSIRQPRWDVTFSPTTYARISVYITALASAGPTC
jgi:hypothetical protein